jgi:hypothetical protein
MVQNDQNVDDWFCCEARNGGAPDVLNVDKTLTEDPRQQRCFPFESCYPLRIVVAAGASSTIAESSFGYSTA